MSVATPTDILKAANRALEREQQELVEEQRAFERFAKRVAALDTATSAPVGPATHVHDRPKTGLSDVRDAYIETVMSVSHYSERYGDTWAESIAEEFSTELAVALDRHVTLQPRLKRLVLDVATQAATTREQFLDNVETECEAIDAAERELTSRHEEIHSLLDQPLAYMEFNALRLTRVRLEKLQQQCNERAKKRQAEIHRRQWAIRDDIGDLEQYLYQECEHTYPILAAIAQLGDLIEQTLETVDRFLEDVLFDTTGGRSKCV